MTTDRLSLNSWYTLTAWRGQHAGFHSEALWGKSGKRCLSPSHYGGMGVCPQNILNMMYKSLYILAHFNSYQELTASWWLEFYSWGISSLNLPSASSCDDWSLTPAEYGHDETACRMSRSPVELLRVIVQARTHTYTDRLTRQTALPGPLMTVMNATLQEWKDVSDV